MTNTTQKPYIFDPVSGEWFRVVRFGLASQGDIIFENGRVVEFRGLGTVSPLKHYPILMPCDPPPLPQSKEVVEAVEAAGKFRAASHDYPLFSRDYVIRALRDIEMAETDDQKIDLFGVVFATALNPNSETEK